MIARILGGALRVTAADSDALSANCTCACSPGEFEYDLITHETVRVIEAQE